MTKIEQSEQELSQFLDQQHQESLQTWNRERTTDELSSFVARRLAQFDEIA